jgi:hypothetical protein
VNRVANERGALDLQLQVQQRKRRMLVGSLYEEPFAETLNEECRDEPAFDFRLLVAEFAVGEQHFDQRETVDVIYQIRLSERSTNGPEFSADRQILEE